MRLFLIGFCLFSFKQVAMGVLFYHLNFEELLLEKPSPGSDVVGGNWCGSGCRRILGSDMSAPVVTSEGATRVVSDLVEGFDGWMKEDHVVLPPSGSAGGHADFLGGKETASTAIGGGAAKLAALGGAMRVVSGYQISKNAGGELGAPDSWPFWCEYYSAHARLGRICGPKKMSLHRGK